MEVVMVLFAVLSLLIMIGCIIYSLVMKHAGFVIPGIAIVIGIVSFVLWLNIASDSAGTDSTETSNVVAVKPVTEEEPVLTENPETEDEPISTSTSTIKSEISMFVAEEEDEGKGTDGEPEGFTASDPGVEESKGWSPDLDTVSEESEDTLKSFRSTSPFPEPRARTYRPRRRM